MKAIGVTIVVVVVTVLFFSPFVWMAWQWVAVPVFGVPPLAFWQVCLAVLGSRALTGSQSKIKVKSP